MTTWGGAYHWGKDTSISAVKALQLRESGRLEAGDCWCCKDCYNAKPRKGIQIFPREHKTTPHFWVGSGASYTLSECEGYKLQKFKGESFRYTQFYRDLKTWLSNDDAKATLQFSEYEEEKSRKYSDFLLQLEQPVQAESKLSLLIIHKNRKRRPFHPLTVVIDLSQWTLEQLNDFAFGKRKIIEEFEQLTNPPEPEAPALMKENYNENWKNSLASIMPKDSVLDSIILLNQLIRQATRLRNFHSDLLVVETFLSENEQAWQDLTFDEFSEYFRKHLKQHFPLVCSVEENSFRAVVEFVDTPNPRQIRIQCTDPSLEAIINEINEIHNIEISFIRQKLGCEIFDVKDKHSAIPHFCNFVDLAKAQWDRVKSEQKYKQHRQIWKEHPSKRSKRVTDFDELGELNTEIAHYSKAPTSPQRQYELYQKMKEKEQLQTHTDAMGYNLLDVVYVDRFVYYLFFGKYRKSNRW